MTFACTATRSHYDGPPFTERDEQLPTFTLEAASKDEADRKARAVLGAHVSFNLEEKH